MSWILKKDTLFDKSEKEITYFLPTASESEKRMIKNGSDLIDVVGEFVIGYDESKQVSKKVFNKLNKFLDLNADYKINWSLTLEGELVNEKGQVISIFSNPTSFQARLIKLLPEVYDAAQELVRDLSSTNGLALKKIYNKICDFYDKTWET